MAFNSALALANVSEVKDFLKKEDDKDLAVLDVIANGIGEMFNRYCDRTFIQATYTNLYLDGSGCQDLYLPNYPVTTLTSVAENDVALTVDTDYVAYLDRGRLRKVLGETGKWTDEPKGIKVTYTAGYTLASVPSDLKMAFLVQVSIAWSNYQRKSWNEVSRSVASQNVTYSDAEIVPFVKTILDRYRRRKI